MSTQTDYNDIQGISKKTMGLYKYLVNILEQKYIIYLVKKYFL